MHGRGWKLALIAAAAVLSVSACVGWGGYPPAKNVHESQLIGTWRARDCGTTVVLHPEGAASATGIPTEMELDSKVTHRVNGDGTWRIDEVGGEQQLDVAMGYVALFMFSSSVCLPVWASVGDHWVSECSREIASAHGPARPGPLARVSGGHVGAPERRSPPAV